MFSSLRVRDSECLHLAHQVSFLNTQLTEADKFALHVNLVSIHLAFKPSVKNVHSPPNLTLQLCITQPLSINFVNKTQMI